MPVPDAFLAILTEQQGGGCSLQDFCKESGLDCFESIICTEHPWEQCYSESICPIAAYFIGFGISDRNFHWKQAACCKAYMKIFNYSIPFFYCMIQKRFLAEVLGILLKREQSSSCNFATEYFAQLNIPGSLLSDRQLNKKRLRIGKRKPQPPHQAVAMTQRIT